MSRKNREGRQRLEHWQMISVLLTVYDYLAVCAAYFLALWLRFDGVFSAIPPSYLEAYLRFIFPFSAVCIVLFWLFKLYNSMWRFAGYADFARIFSVSLAVSILHALCMTWLVGRMPLSYYVIGAGFQFAFLVTAGAGLTPVPPLAYGILVAVLAAVPMAIPPMPSCGSPHFPAHSP